MLFVLFSLLFFPTFLCVWFLVFFFCDSLVFCSVGPWTYIIPTSLFPFTLRVNRCCDEASILVPSTHNVWVRLLCLRAVFIAVSQPAMNPSSYSLRPAHPPGDSVSTWTSVWDWHLQMLLTVVELGGSSSHSKVQMFLFSFPCFGCFFSRREKRGGFPLWIIGTRFVCLLFPQCAGKHVLCV